LLTVTQATVAPETKTLLALKKVRSPILCPSLTHSLTRTYQLDRRQ
jgi:hypothetical protein